MSNVVPFSKTAWLLYVVLALPFWTANARAGEVKPMDDPLAASRQALVVMTNDWKSPTATLLRYERRDLKSTWTLTGETLSVMVGRNGLAWGQGLHRGTSPDEPSKREGDGKAPAGIFRLSTAFGYDAPETMTWVLLPYRQATPHLLCVDDPASRYYNRVVDSSHVATDWKSFEEMRRRDDQYRLGIVVDHNVDPVVSGGGSCIFLHIWAGPNRATSGCTALAAENVEKLMRWLDPQANPVLVQMPMSVYGRYRKDWGLP